MERVAEKLADYLIKKNAIMKEDYEIYKYGFQTGIEMFVCIVTCFIVAIYMGMLGEFAIFFIIFFTLRAYVGGLHMNTFFKCFLCSCIVFFLTLILIKYIPLSKSFSIRFSFLETLIILLVRPVENVNRPVSETEKKEFKSKIREITLGITIVVLIFGSLDLKNLLNTITYTLGVIIVSMFLGKIKNIIDERMEIR